MKKLILVLCAGACAFVVTVSRATETWELRLVIDVPRVADNGASLGYRKYQRQSLVGCVEVERHEDREPDVSFCSLRNLTHKMNGAPVTYEASVEDVFWHAIGSNLTGIFNTASVTLSIIAEPSYALGPEPTEDNSLVITLSGKGNGSAVQGYLAGNIGCGCREYGHVSPTRIWGTGDVVDTAAVYGRWKARRIR